MSDRYRGFVQSTVGKKVAQNLGLPMPVELERYQAGKNWVDGSIIVGASNQSIFFDSIIKILDNIQANVYHLHDIPEQKLINIASHQSNLQHKVAIFDASGIQNSSELKQVYEFFHPIARAIEKSGRVIIVARLPEDCDTVKQATAQRALEGFVKSVGKEFKRGITSQLIYLKQNAKNQLETTLRFFISPRSAYVSGQVIRIQEGLNNQENFNWNKPLASKTILVTGASRGIGEAIARVLARDGAYVICLDMPSQQAELQKLAGEIGGATLPLDITASNAGEKIAEVAKKRGWLDGIVHNAGITRDKTLAKMDESMWDSVINVNLTAEEMINDYLLSHQVFNHNARIICVSSISGIAGNLGQTNYAMSKAGVIGMVQALAPTLKNAITINAVAPGFIETQMTAKIPFAIREAGRRMNAMSQGGLPVDVAETIAWLASPASSGINGNIVRVCGQSVLGA